MNKSKCWVITRVLSLLIAGLCIVTSSAQAAVRLPHIIGSNMVLQRDKAIPVWGWGEAGEEVTVEFAGQKVSTKTNTKGNWIVRLSAVKAGGPYEMSVRGSNTIRFTNVMVGEVWLCSGQSNMKRGIRLVTNLKQEIAAADYPNIRLFNVPMVSWGVTKDDVESVWRPCSPETIKLPPWQGFSAVGYFFGRELHKQLNVPVGLICSAWGGTRIEPWTPMAGLAEVPEVYRVMMSTANATDIYRQNVARSLGPIEKWIEECRKAIKEGQTLPLRPVLPRHPLDDRTKPTSLYNSMIHPLVPFAIRGVTWYQGEANRDSGDGMTYRYKMEALIRGWRKIWAQGDFPFYYVQLAPFKYEAGDALWLPEIWEAQTAALSIPHTGMAVTVDIGNLRDIHPRNKQDVGKRLALWALAKTYGRSDLVYSGPLYKSTAVEGSKVRISFDHTGSGLASRDSKALTWFQIAGADKKFVEAEAKIDGDTVVVSSDAVTAPVVVRFAWHQEAQPNLMNKEGLPASPFRTDRWRSGRE